MIYFAFALNLAVLTINVWLMVHNPPLTPWQVFAASISGLALLSLWRRVLDRLRG